jgi:peptide/nickel transport system substrate-binding protein
VGWQAGRIELERWDGYRGTLPSIQKGTFRWIPDDRERIRLLRNRKVDLVSDVPVELISEIRADSNLELLQIPSLRVLFTAFDMKNAKTPYVDAPVNPFLDRRVRLAVSRAVDRGRLVHEIFQGVNEAATQLVAPAVFGYDAAAEVPTYNLDAARQLMKEAGYPNGFSVVLDTPEQAYPGDVEIADFIARALKEIGIRVTVNAMPKQKLFEKLARRDTSFYMLSWNCLSADSQEVFSYLLHTPGGGYGSDNSGSYSNSDVDRLAEQAAQTMDSSKRLELLKSALAEVTNDIPWVPIYIQTHVFGVNKRLQWQPREDKVLLFSEMTLKE